MAELQPPEGPVNGGGAVVVVGGSTEHHQHHLGLGSKRQRRPSVRLGDIGDQPATLSYDSYIRRSKQWNNTNNDSTRFHRHQSHKDPRSSKTRPLMNIGNGGGGGGGDSHETLEIEDKNGDGGVNLDLLAIGNRKAKRGKRVRSNWGTSKVDEGGDKFSEDEGFRDFDPEDSQSPLKEHSPIHSLENPAIDLGHHNGNEKDGLFSGQRRTIRARVSASRDHDGIELDGPSDTDAWKCGTSNGGGEKGRFWYLEDGIRMWLNGLGLGRYVPVFEIHEVDEEVLPLLTLDDLKDMGINAVGSRRKLYAAIQKLAKGFS